MDDVQREVLERPFSSQEVRQREGNFGKKLNYLEGHSVIRRLNEAFNSDWGFIILSREFNEIADEVIVHGRITVGDLVKDAVGSVKVKRHKETGQIVDLGNDMKAASTDALKKASSLLGIGLYLYADTEHAGPGRPAVHSQHSYRTLQGASEPYSQAGQGQPSQGQTRRLSAKQLSYILKLANQSSISKSQLNTHCQTRCGVVVDFLSKDDASQLIDDLRHQRVTINDAA